MGAAAGQAGQAEAGDSRGGRARCTRGSQASGDSDIKQQSPHPGRLALQPVRRLGPFMRAGGASLTRGPILCQAALRGLYRPARPPALPPACPPPSRRVDRLRRSTRRWTGRSRRGSAAVHQRRATRPCATRRSETPARRAHGREQPCTRVPRGYGGARVPRCYSLRRSAAAATRRSYRPGPAVDSRPRSPPRRAGSGKPRSRSSRAAQSPAATPRPRSLGGRAASVALLFPASGPPPQCRGGRRDITATRRGAPPHPLRLPHPLYWLHIPL